MTDYADPVPGADHSDNADPDHNDDPGPYLLPDPPEGGAPARFFDVPVGLEDVEPSEEALAKAREAHVRSRLVDIHHSTQKMVTRAIFALGAAIADVQAAKARFALSQRKVRMAEIENRRVRELAPPTGGSHYDPHSRPLGRLGLLLTLTVCIIGDYLVDRGSLLVFRLPLEMTETLALLAAVIQTLSAHTVGKLLRRLKEARDRTELAHEETKMRILIGLIVLMVIALATIRAARGNFLMAALVLGVGAASAMVAIAASYFHANTRLDAIKNTDTTIQHTGNKATNHGRDLLRAEAKEIAARDTLQATAADVVARIDLVYVNHNVDPNGNEPAWVHQLRNWSAGHDLPFTSTQQP